MSDEETVSDEEKIDDGDNSNKKMSNKKKAAIAAAVILTGGTAGIAIVAAHHEIEKNPDGKVAKAAKVVTKPIADNPDGKITMFAEKVPVVGYGVAAAHAINEDNDRAKRAAAKCTGSTVGAAISVGAATVTVASGGTLAAPAAAATGAAVGAVSGAASTFAESQIAKTIENEEIKQQCNQGTAKDYVKAVAIGGTVGAVMGGADIDFGNTLEDIAGDVVINETIEQTEEAGIKGAAKVKELLQEDEKNDDSDYWEYDPQQMDKIYICTGQGQKYICCDKKGSIKCEKKGKDGTVFQSIPHETDESKVALKSNGYYLFIDESNKKDPVKTSEEIYYLKVLSHSNSKFSFVSENGHYLYFKKGGFGGGYKISTKLKKDIKLAEIKFFVSNASE